MFKRRRSALLCILLLATHIFQGNLAAAVPCADDSPGVLVVCAVDGSQDSLASAECDGTVAPGDQCPFHSSKGCQLTQTPALAVAFAPTFNVQLDSSAGPSPAVDSFRVHFDPLLRPPK